MPCCILALLALVGPRVILVLIWLFNNAYLKGLANNFILLCAGFIFLPWTTLAYAFAINTFPGAQVGGLDTTGLVVLIVGFIFDLFSYGGGGYHRRRVFA